MAAVLARKNGDSCVTTPHEATGMKFMAYAMRKLPCTVRWAGPWPALHRLRILRYLPGRVQSARRHPTQEASTAPTRTSCNKRREARFLVHSAALFWRVLCDAHGLHSQDFACVGMQAQAVRNSDERTVVRTGEAGQHAVRQSRAELHHVPLHALLERNFKVEEDRPVLHSRGMSYPVRSIEVAGIRARAVVHESRSQHPKPETRLVGHVLYDTHNLLSRRIAVMKK